MIISNSRNGNSLHGIVGHRGAAARAPENTMAAFKQALADGADAIELDVLKTKDGHFLVMHDDKVDRTTDGTGRVADLTLEQAQKLDAGSWFDPKFAGERPPELGQVLEWAKDKIHVVVEVKRETAAASSGKELVEILRDKGVSEDVTVMSFNRGFVERVEAQAPELDTGTLISAVPTRVKTGVGAALGGLAAGLAAGFASGGNPLVTAASSLLGLATGALAGRAVGLHKAKALVRATTADSVMPHWSVATKGLVNTAHSADKNVVPYTVDRPLIASRLRGNGVDGLITNKPHLFVES